MKKYLSKKILWQSLLSLSAIGIFILLAVGSDVIDLDAMGIVPTYSRDMTYNEKTNQFTETEAYSRTKKTTIGTRDRGAHRWHGKVTVTYESIVPKYYDFKEEVEMVHGKRNGTSTITYLQSGTVIYKCYNMGIKVECKKAAPVNEAEISAYQVLSSKYPWYLFALNATGFKDADVESYIDTLEEIMGTNEFEDDEFDDYYDDAIEVLEETPYDSIIVINSLLSFMNGFELIKDSELRMAVIDHYRSDVYSTYDIVSTTYPGYLLSLQEGDVTDQDFEEFSQDLDSCMASYGSLDLEDPFFIDSVDSWLYRAIMSIYETEDSDSTDILKSAARLYVHNDLQSIWHEINSMLIQYSVNSTPAEVSEVVLYFIVMQFIQGDIIKRSVWKSYLINKGVVSVPTVTTVFEAGNSATSVTLNGYVLEDGGAEVNSRGITWASYYNPTTDDHLEASGTGMGAFQVTLTGLTEGDTYYARTYATNSTGTAYGNCVQFIVQSTVGIEENGLFDLDFSIYPNPVSAFATFSFQMEYSANMELTIVDLKGGVVYQNDLGSLPRGDHQINLDLSALKSGIYSCQLTKSGTAQVTRKLVIVR